MKWSQIKFEKQSVDKSTWHVNLKEIEESINPNKNFQFNLEEYGRKLSKKSIRNVSFIGDYLKSYFDWILLACSYELLMIGKVLESKNFDIQYDGIDNGWKRRQG